MLLVDNAMLLAASVDTDFQDFEQQS